MPGRIDIWRPRCRYGLRSLPLTRQMALWLYAIKPGSAARHFKPPGAAGCLIPHAALTPQPFASRSPSSTARRRLG